MLKAKMKTNIPLILNFILLIAVGILYYLHFKNHNGESSKVFTPEIVTSSGSSHTGVYYINTDSLLSNYEFYKKQEAELENEQTRMQNQLKSQGEKLEQEFYMYQQQGATMTDNQRAEKEADLAKKQQAFMTDKDELVEKLDQKQMNASNALYDRVNAFLKKMKSEGRINYVLGFKKGGSIFYANDSLDITSQVLKGLNDEYKQELK
jgi:outer membrane protein